MAQHQAEEGAEKQDAGQKRRGRRLETPGASHNNKPTFNEYKPEMYWNCGRTDVLSGETEYKTITDNT